MIEPGSIPAALLGGGIIGISATLMLAMNGRILGVSGIVAGIFSPGVAAGDRWLRALFVAGMLAGGIVMGAALPQVLPGAITAKRGLLIAAGLAVGFGTRMGGGCTSGHGVCGLARLSPRSLVATVTFMVSAIVTVYVIRHVLGGL